jgi:malate dehydrogenase
MIFNTSHQETIHVLITGGAGRIAYALCHLLANHMGMDAYRIHLHLHDCPAMQDKLEGLCMELQDCNTNVFEKITCGTSLSAIPFEKTVHWVYLIGASPRQPGMERSDLIQKNGAIFREMGQWLHDKTISKYVIVVGNPCNTNAMILASHMKPEQRQCVMALTYLDQSRATVWLKHYIANVYQKAMSEPISPTTVNLQGVAIWGNHSATLYPSIDFARLYIHHERAFTLKEWLETFAPDYCSVLADEWVPFVQQRGASVLSKQGVSSAASAAQAIADFSKELSQHESMSFFSAGIITTSQTSSLYQKHIEPGLCYSVPMVKANGMLTSFYFKQHEFSDTWKAHQRNNVAELLAEKKIANDLGLLGVVT